MSSTGHRFTPEQEAAIKHRGGALLVSAAAGSGKTRVLVERLLGFVEDGQNINEFLVITYTRASAAELRERIQNEIMHRLSEAKEKKHLWRQSMLCKEAPIGTIHAFCTDILRENAHLTGLQPDFRVADETEAVIIKSEVLEEVLDKAYGNLQETEQNNTPAPAPAHFPVPASTPAHVPTAAPATVPTAPRPYQPTQNTPKNQSTNAQTQTSNSQFSILNSQFPSSPFAALVNTVSPGRDDKKLSETVLSIHAKLQSVPDLKSWAEWNTRIMELEGITDVIGTTWGKYLMRKAESIARFRRDEMLLLLEQAKAHGDFYAAYGASMEATVTGIRMFIDALSDSWDEARRHAIIEFPRPKAIKGYEDLKDIRTRCKEAMKKCASVFECSSSEQMEDMRAAAPAMAALLKLITDFDHAYRVEKIRRGVVDFSDLEHLALSLLIDKETGEKTTLAGSISKRFKEIMIDEYQDVNAVQEMIFNAISQEGSNIFMVGDVKQSIYRFRLADPAIFLEKYKTFKEHAVLFNPPLDSPDEKTIYITQQSTQNAQRLTPKSHNPPPSNSDSAILNSQLSTINSEHRAVCGTTIHLSKNFRSRPGILKAVNQVFSQIMSVEFGEMDYTEKEQLVQGKEDDADTEPDSGAQLAVEFNVIDINTPIYDNDEDGNDDEENPSKTQAEARHIALRIKELTGCGSTQHSTLSFQPSPASSLGSQATPRSYHSYSDIVILLRSLKNKAWQYAAALREQGIPVDMPGGEGYFETIEVSAALSLLTVIDNPMQDIPLAAALRGPVYGFSADELAEIRAGSMDTGFYEALAIASETNERCAVFMRDINKLRMLAPDMPADRFIWHMYNKTGLLARVGAMRNGDRRRENLILLAENARNLEQSGYKGLHGFLAFIRGLQERGTEPISDAAVSEQNAVRIMSIHKSKGLEFPVVFLADTSKKPNNADARQPLVFHSEFGIGCMRTDLERRIEYTTLARTAIQSKLTSEMMAEELRVLYVAMTRAEKKLIITAALSDAQKEMEKLSKLVFSNNLQENRKIAPQIMEEIKTPAGWLLISALNARQNFIAISIHSPRIGNQQEAVGRQQEIVKSPYNMVNSQLSEYEDTQCKNPQPASPAPAFSVIPSPLPAPDSQPDSPLYAFNPPLSVPDSQLTAHLSALHAQLSYSYPHKNATNLPSKLTVTQIKDKHPDLEKDPDSAQFDVSRQAVTNHNIDQPPPAEGENSQFSILTSRLGKQSRPILRPDFITQQAQMTAAEKGTALHMAMQYIDYAACGDVESINRELERLVASNYLTSEQVRNVDARKIMHFFNSGIGKRLLRAQNVKREFKFTLLTDAGQFYPGEAGSGCEDSILIQGVVDCFFEEDGELIVIDFKTDYVTVETQNEKAASYFPQIAAYSAALERITQKHVKECAVYFFATGEAVALERLPITGLL